MKKNQTIPEYSIEQFFAMRIISGISVSPDGKNIAYITNTTGIPNVWTIPVNGGWSNQITISENAVKVIDHSNDRNNIIFQSDTNGDENLQIFITGNNGGEVISITQDHKGSQVFYVDTNKDGSKILFTSNKRDKRFFDTYVYDIKTKKETMIYKSDNIFVETPSYWSSDEKMIALTTFYNNMNNDISYLDIEKKVKINFTAHEGFMKNYDAKISKDKKRIYFLSDYKSEFIGLAYYDMKKEKNDWLIREKWDITGYKIAPSGKFILYNLNEDGRSKLKMINLKNKKVTNIELPQGNVLDFKITNKEDKIILLFDQPDNPADIYVYDLNSKSLEQITFSMIGGIPREHLITPKKIKYKSFDGQNISALLYIPKNAKKNGKNPGILWPHGGPEFQEKDMYRQYFQIMCNRGYVIIAPNFRGSTGYGKTFQRKIYKDWGGAEFKDYMEGVKFLLKTGYVDKKKVAIVGGSFGGFSTLTAVTKSPGTWKCAVDIFGPSNLVTFADSVPEHWKPAVYELVGDPENDKDYFYDRSPINFVDKIKCPILIVQGANDPRVVQNESDQMVNKLKKMKKEVEYIVLQDEGHGFSKVSNQILVWNKIDKFLKKYLG